MTDLERFWAKVNKTDDCWLWTAAAQHGYGKFKADGRPVRVHRWAYKMFVGPIPAGLTIDHTCHTRDVATCVGGDDCLHRRCVNPSHLEAVTQKVNVNRGAVVMSRRTHCRRKHEYTPENTIVTATGARQCRTCTRAYHRNYYRLKKAA